MVWRRRPSCLSRGPPFEKVDAPGLAIGLVVGTICRLLTAVKNRGFYEICGKSSIAERLFFEYSSFLGCDSVSLD